MNLFKLRRKYRNIVYRNFIIFLICTAIVLLWESWMPSFELKFVLAFFFVMTIVLLLALIGEEQRFQNYQQIYDMKKVEQQLNSADRVFYLLNKPILYMTDDYAIFNNGGIIIEDKKNINRVEEKVQSIRNSRNFTYLIRVVTFEGKKWEIARINSKENDEKWKKFKKVLSDINTYLTMDKYYNVKNEEMENY